MSKNIAPLLVLVFLTASCIICKPPVGSIVTFSVSGSAQISSTEEGLAILNDVVGLDLSKYTVTSEEREHADPEGLTIDTIFYTLLSNGSKVTMLVEFAYGKLLMIHVLDVIGPLYLTKPATSISVTEMAQVFLRNYQTYTSNPIYGELMATLDNVDISQNVNKTIGNAHLEVFEGNSNRPSFKWYYTSNGAVAPYSKFLALGFKNGFLEAFVDKWQLYTIGSTSVNLSKEQAIAVALNIAKTYSWSVKLDNSTLDAKNFGESNVRWTALIFDGSLDSDKTHSGGFLTLYPVWRVGVALDKWYGNMYGIEVDVWADNGEVRSVQEAWSMMPPPEGSATASTSPPPTPSPTEPPNQDPSPSSAPPQSDDKTETSTSSNAEPFPTTLVIAPIALVIAVGAGLAVYFKKRNQLSEKNSIAPNQSVQSFA